MCSMYRIKIHLISLPLRDVISEILTPNNQLNVPQEVLGSMVAHSFF